MVKTEKRIAPILFDQVDQIQIGQPKDDVIQIFGKPSEELFLQVHSKDVIILEYKNSDEYKSQRLSVLLDPVKKTVVSKTFIPNEGELEGSTKYLVGTKYKTLKFTRFEKPQCHSHYSSSSDMLLNFENGILIDYYKKDSGTFSDVFAISWMTQEHLTELIERIKSCNKP